VCPHVAALFEATTTRRDFPRLAAAKPAHTKRESLKENKTGRGRTVVGSFWVDNWPELEFLDMFVASAVVEALQEFDQASLAPQGSAEWLELLMEMLQRAEIAAEQVCLLNLLLFQRYGLECLTGSTSKLIAALFDQWSGAGEEEGEEDGDERRKQVSKMLSSLRSLGWFKMHRGSLLAVLHRAIKVHIEERCKDEFQRPFIPELRQWLQFTLMPFLEAAVGNSSSSSSNGGGGGGSSTNTLPAQMTDSLLKALAETRAQELFNIVADFPDSMCAVKELKEAMSSTGMLSVVGKEFKSTVQRRLLHMGASTTQIVTFYVSMIRALRVVDSSDLLLNFVAAPVRRYLRDRKDTVRCVVAALTEGKGSELHGELRKGGSLEYGPDEDDEDAGPGDAWEPRKRNLELVEFGGRGLDVLALLVSIYGSTDLFVSDYRAVLADKLLLSNHDYRADQELATLELLKIRFGEEALHCCEVMLRDLEESRRVNVMLQALPPASSAMVLEQQPQDVPVDCLIVSENYWPALQTDSLTLPPPAAAALSAYQARYAAAKKPRKLHVASQLGLVDIDLQFDDGTVRNFLVTPVQASLIMFLADTDEGSMTLEQLGSKCELEESDVQRRMGFWLAREVVQVGGSGVGGGSLIYSILEDQALRSASGGGGLAGGEGSDEVVQMTVTSDVTEKAALVQIETYVKGLLTNHGSMALERIHSMLKLMIGTGGAQKFDMNLVQLQVFLQGLVDCDTLESGEGQFRIRAGRG